MLQVNIHEQHLATAQLAVEALTQPAIGLISEIWLHGSVARRTDNDLSDVDLLVVLRESYSLAWLECIDQICGRMDQAKISLRPRSRRGDKFPGYVQVDFEPEAEFKNPALRDRKNNTKFLETVLREGRRLYPVESEI
ncbi:nucleotidyltransferase domain-containing protein [Candidatus Collierbacteria bacterium]|nr:nucleotidyltransferase domain-containing protein [Candidatus Collierbacteria bacterium]